MKFNHSMKICKCGLVKEGLGYHKCAKGGEERGWEWEVKYLLGCLKGGVVLHTEEETNRIEDVAVVFESLIRQQIEKAYDKGYEDALKEVEKKLFEKGIFYKEKPFDSMYHGARWEMQQDIINLLKQQ